MHEGTLSARLRRVFSLSKPAGLQKLFFPLLLFAIAFLIRGFEFANPRIDVDENFYLLVGDRMLQGAWPYVDIWDRKPVGLFLIYAAIRLLGGEGIVQYQVVATIFAGATSVVIAAMARRIATPIAAVVSAVLYLLMLGLAGGGGGQSPIFYNLFMALAASLVLDSWLDNRSGASLGRRGCVAMLLVGIAMQIKYTAAFEGIFFGAAMLLRTWQGSRSISRIALNCAMWSGVAVAPTILALAVYVVARHGQAFVYANFVSIGGRSSEPAAEIIARLVKTGRLLALPLSEVLLATILRHWQRLPVGAPTYRFVLAWLAAAFAGYAIFGSYFNHYALPLLVPLSVAMAPAFSERRKYIGAGVAVLTVGIAIYFNVREVRNHEMNWGTRAAVRSMTDQIRSRLQGCLYVFRGDPILYYLTDACIPTRYAFSTHLTLRREAGGVGVDPLVEIQRIFATHPSIVVDTVADDERDDAKNALAMGRRELARDYRVVAAIPAAGLASSSISDGEENPIIHPYPG